ncbi:MAG: hypothetical protein A2722_02570 [Candidatus Doudnabacteria bacterium RIFCSPHIGHO2_01_FULL_50_11]|uniref:PPM-type phosphatase domain-containing protein n=1 Tax=Candidatus Doudnabacteria bacterium RIFCSPHIGHO2_01_FULL_50_11 TaxID=1817828 RepID=A0A1F5PLJ0_9BACT|nr:MAG: hypothetical protein A2722_02570 [Candidatus Doudnabacteria bacterium RIFCSPHIGHO2_01_FULL_50_11]HLC45054.1 hypothetical protein [Patescibacteria group bacterium]
MANKLIISQIFLPNAKQAQNFVSIYEESIRPDSPASLFLLIEIRGERHRPATEKREEYEKIASRLARTLKQTFLADSKISELTFEQALSNLNSELSHLAKTGVIGWYKRLNALVAAQVKSSLFVTVTGNCTAYLLRGREFTLISEPPATSGVPHPMKTFTNFATGTLAENDHIIFSTASLYNYLSLERLRTMLKEQTLEQASKSIISMLRTDAQPTDAFASFICRLSQHLTMPDTELHPLFTPSSHTIIDDAENFKKTSTSRSLAAGQAFAATIWRGIVSTLSALFAILSQYILPSRVRNEKHMSRRISRKTLLSAIAVVVVIFIASLAYSNLRNARIQTQTDMKRALESASQNITDAEASLIYDDQKHATESYLKAKEALDKLQKGSYFQSEAHDLALRLDALSNKLNKTTTVDSIEILGTFLGTPDRLIKTASGFVGLNSYTDAIEIFDASSRTFQDSALSPTSHEDFSSGAQIAGATVGFISRGGRLYALDTSSGTMRATTPTSTGELSVQALLFFGNRAYAIDQSSGQILRYDLAQSGYGAPANWLKTAQDFKNVTAMAIDGNIWVLTQDGVKKYTRGEEQSFAIAQLPSPLRDPTAIWTDQASPKIYIADPSNSRIVVLNKEGGLAAQYSSSKFSDLKDFWIDEAAKTVYVIIGNQLGRFTF